MNKSLHTLCRLVLCLSRLSTSSFAWLTRAFPSLFPPLPVNDNLYKKSLPAPPASQREFYDSTRIKITRALCATLYYHDGVGADAPCPIAQLSISLQSSVSEESDVSINPPVLLVSRTLTGSKYGCSIASVAVSRSFEYATMWGQLWCQYICSQSYTRMSHITSLT